MSNETDTLELELWIAWDRDGDYAISKDGEDEAVEAFQDEIGSGYHMQVAKITVTVPVPKALEGTVTIPDTQAKTVDVSTE